MHFQTFTLVALAAVATAFPLDIVSANNETSTLFERATKAWIASHSKVDCAHNSVKGAKPDLSLGVCIQFAATTDFTGIFWGEAKYRMDKLEAYQNKDCSGTPWEVIPAQSKAGSCLKKEAMTGVLAVKAVKAVKGYPPGTKIVH